MIFKKECVDKDAMLMPTEFHSELKNFPGTAVTFFSKKLLKLFLKKYECSEIAFLENETMVFPVYKVKIKNRNLAVYQSPVGAPASATLFEEIVALGASNILAVGCCGCLDKNLKVSDLIVPNCAIRDEGLSDHYLKIKDEIELNQKMVDFLCQSLDRQNQSYAVGKTWTTDGLYRETFKKLERFKKQGAIVVEMETSALASVAEFRKVNFAQILYGADSLAGENYDKRAFRGETVPKKTEGIVDIALLCGADIDRDMKKLAKINHEKPKIRKFGLFRNLVSQIQEKKKNAKTK